MDINYFGYGANQDPDMMEAIIGRKPVGIPVYVEGYELCVQVWNFIPEEAKAVLKKYWKDTDSFQTYTLRKIQGKKTKGTLWKITAQDREKIRKWELVGIWYIRKKIQVITKEKKTISAETEIILDQKKSLITATSLFAGSQPIFINGKEKMIRVANYYFHSLEK